VSVLLLFSYTLLLCVDLGKGLYLLFPFQWRRRPKEICCCPCHWYSSYRRATFTRGKKSTYAGASLETHQSTSSSGDVRVDTGMLSFVSCIIFILT
jgi:hypothetical protein